MFAMNTLDGKNPFTFERSQVEGLVENYLNVPQSQRNGNIVSADGLLKVFMQTVKGSIDKKDPVIRDQLRLSLASQERIYNSNSEIGSHSYSHKDLANISQTELNEELNSTNIIFNAITKDNLKYLRPPYNSYNDNLLNQGYKIISWNIDPKDWLLKDSDKIYNNVISSSCDGCIVIMHDIYEETIEATKKLIPKLNEMGYEVVSISKLAEIKNYNFETNEVTTIIRSDE